jgi:DNA-directed RNA polymerase subunit M/transcription elongation factor TFIIS
MADALYITRTSSLNGASQTLTKAAGDTVADKSQYSELVKIPDWRLLLSDAGVSPFEWKGKQWKTADHAMQASGDEDNFHEYSLNSGSVVARGAIARTHTPSDEVVAEILKAKFRDEKARKVLALTGQAQLWTAQKGKKIRWTALEEIREAQRNATVEPEMDAEAKAKAAPKTKAPKTKKTQAEAAAPAAPVNAFAENTVAAPAKEVVVTPPDLSADYTESSLKFCPVCDNYLYMEVDPESQALTRLCRKCGHKEDDTKGGLVMEMMIQQQSSEGYKILLNEFTRKDPRLPHIRKNISCPNVTCDSNKGGKDPDVIYIKYDLVNLMYLYICDICGEKWHSRDRS